MSQHYASIGWTSPSYCPATMKHWTNAGLTPNAFSPHGALKHHFTSLKTDLIFLQPRVLERKLPWNWFTNTWRFSLFFHPLTLLVYQYTAIFFIFSPTSNHLRPLQVEDCDSDSRLVVDEDDNDKFRLKSVKALAYFSINHGNQRLIFNLKSS